MLFDYVDTYEQLKFSQAMMGFVMPSMDCPGGPCTLCCCREDHDRLQNTAYLRS